jgi:hypothetical protein
VKLRQQCESARQQLTNENIDRIHKALFNNPSAKEYNKVTKNNNKPTTTRSTEGTNLPAAKHGADAVLVLSFLSNTQLLQTCDKSPQYFPGFFLITK